MLIGREDEQRTLDALRRRRPGRAQRRAGADAVRPGSARPRCWRTRVGAADRVPAAAGARGRAAEHDLPFAGLARVLGPLLGGRGGPPGAAGARPRRRAGAAHGGRRGPVRGVGGRADPADPGRESGPLGLVVDDAHLLDTPSAQALAFVARRLLVDAVVVLVAVRPGTGEAVARPAQPSTWGRWPRDAAARWPTSSAATALSARGSAAGSPRSAPATRSRSGRWPRARRPLEQLRRRTPEVPRWSRRRSRERTAAIGPTGAPRAAGGRRRVRRPGRDRARPAPPRGCRWTCSAEPRRSVSHRRRPTGSRSRTRSSRPRSTPSIAPERAAPAARRRGGRAGPGRRRPSGAGTGARPCWAPTTRSPPTLEQGRPGPRERGAFAVASAALRARRAPSPRTREARAPSGFLAAGEAAWLAGEDAGRRPRCSTRRRRAGPASGPGRSPWPGRWPPWAGRSRTRATS